MNNSNVKVNNNHKKPSSRDVLDVFSKKFNYQNLHNNWHLPSAHNLYKESYQWESLQKLKIKLNEVKSKLNNYNIDHWSQHSRLQDPTTSISQKLKNVTKAEFVTVAWCKFYECLCTYPQLIPKPHLNTLHLCEAPGAFVAALNHYLYSNYKKEEVQWNWLATTLNPYHEGNPYNKMIIDDRFMFSSLDHWLFHSDFTGNIINVQNQKSILEECQLRFSNNGEVHLITADGSVNCMQEPEQQEEQVAQLIFAEMTTALTILAPHGCLLMKTFTLFDASSVCKLFLLNCVFEKVCVYKPATSKRGNSELYIICLNYQKQTANLSEILEIMQQNGSSEDKASYPLFVKAAIPKDFLLQHETCCRLFMHYQTKAIEDNIFTFHVNDAQKKNNIKLYIKNLRYRVCTEFYRRYNVKHIAEELKISQSHHDPWHVPTQDKSYSEIKRLNNASRAEKLDELKNHIWNVHQQNDVKEDFTKQQVDMGHSSNYDNTVMYCGKPIDRLHSSLFVWKDVMEIGIKLQFLCPNVEPYIPSDAKVVIIKQKQEINYYTQPAVNFSQQQYNFFYTLVQHLLQMKPFEVEFSKVPFITHFSVSLLKYLSLYVFQSLYINVTSKSITLQSHGENFEKALQHLKMIFEQHCAENDKQDILCFMDLRQLHRQQFNAILLEFNKKILLDNYLYLIMDNQIQ